MLANLGEQRRNFFAGRNGLPEQRWREIAHDHIPCALDVLLAVVRLLAGNALAPAFEAIAVHGDQHDAPGVGAPKARLEEVDERHVQFAKSNGFNFHRKDFTTEYTEVTEETLSGFVITSAARDLLSGFAPHSIRTRREEQIPHFVRDDKQKTSVTSVPPW